MSALCCIYIACFIVLFSSLFIAPSEPYKITYLAHLILLLIIHATSAVIPSYLVAARSEGSGSLDDLGW